MGLRKLNELKSEIEDASKQAASTVAGLQARASVVFAKMMSTTAKRAAVLKIVVAVDASRELTQVQGDEWYHRFARVDFSSLIDTKDTFQKHLLSEYISQEHGTYADFENDCATACEGPCILINDDGDVLDQDTGKWFISKKDYETKEELHAQIEAYMNKTGHFPSVIICDYYGNASYVDTQSPEQRIANQKAMEAQNETK